MKRHFELFCSVVSVLALTSGCAGAGDDPTSSSFGSFGSGTPTTVDSGDDDEAEEDTMEESGDSSGDTTTDGGTDTTTTDGGTTTTDGGTDTTTTDGGTDTTTDGGTTTGGGADCGNGVLDPGESCDGNDFGGATCQSLGYDQGALTCNNCAVDISGCSNTPQPGAGQLYSHCLDAVNCPGLDGCATVTMEGQTDPYDGFCTNLCSSDAECFANVGGTATPVCNDAMTPYCELDCSGGKTCPGGMECVNIVGGAQLCY